ncbi:hypothetical protein CENSYa_0141 [Cenarchaeum symbiosum A]|uniref:Uncharacterized protein n=1 Tax=Cenarchaeum symbiosum (strain A) TaxID=414004 RepID=A0RTW9_CENSY|nr:hypothetical protein CENSYa_0141 [Cenarchaeum symbiosum A]
MDSIRRGFCTCTLHYFCKNASDDGLPRVFKRHFRVFWAAIIVAGLYLCLDLDIGNTIENRDAATILVVNAEILVTTLAVTLGVTLLGIQFRAQTYTMIAMMQQMQNWVVYGFVIVFISLIVLSMIPVGYAAYLQDAGPAGNPAGAEPAYRIAVFIPVLFLGTAFSMLYLAGYVYYMINKLQPDQMMHTVVDGIRDALSGRSGNAAVDVFVKICNDGKKGHDFKEKFAVWEQIMHRAVELNNTLLFKLGLERLMAIYDDVIRGMGDVGRMEGSKVYEMIKDETARESLRGEAGRLPDGKREVTVMLRREKRLFFRYINEVMLACVQYSRKTCSSEFFGEFVRNKEPIPTREELRTSAYKNMMFDVWSTVMITSILGAKDQIMRRAVQNLFKKLETPAMEKNRRWTMAFFHSRIASLVEFAMDPTINTNNQYLLHYLTAFGHYEFPKNARGITARQEFADDRDGKKPPQGTGHVLDANQVAMPSPTEAWSMIMNHAYAQKNTVVFDAGLEAMKKSLQRIRTGTEYRMSIDALSELMGEVLKRQPPGNAEYDYSKRCASSFLKCFTASTWVWLFHDIRITRLWMECIRIIIDAREESTIKYCLERLESHPGDGGEGPYLRSEAPGGDSNVGAGKTGSSPETAKSILQDLRLKLDTLTHMPEVDDKAWASIPGKLEDLGDKYLRQFLLTCANGTGTQCLELQTSEIFRNGMLRFYHSDIGTVRQIMDELRLAVESFHGRKIDASMKHALPCYETRESLLDNLLRFSDSGKVQELFEILRLYEKYNFYAAFYDYVTEGKRRDTVVNNIYSAIDLKDRELVKYTLEYFQNDPDTANRNDLKESIGLQLEKLNENAEWDKIESIVELSMELKLPLARQ